MSKEDRTDVGAGVSGKWGVQVAERGFAQLPNYLLFLNQFLDEERRLSPVELLVVIQLAATWWRKEQLPFPSMATLAVRCGVSQRQIQRAVTKLESISLLKRVKRRSAGIIASNAYDLSPLVTVLETVARAYPNAFPRRIEVGAAVKLLASSPEAPAQLEPPARPKKRLVLKRRVLAKDADP